MDKRLTLLFVLSTAALPADAAEWAFEPGVTGTYRYDDNFRLQRDNEIDVHEASLRAWADFSRRTARSELTGTAGLTERRFDEDDLDTTDLRFDIVSHYNFSLRQRANLDFSLIKDTTLDSLLDETGIVFDRTDRTWANLSPGWTYSYDEKTQFSTSLNLTDVSYDDDAATTGLGDYRNYGINLNAARYISPQTRLIIAAGSSRFERNDNSIESDNQQLTLGLDHRYSERISLGGSLGIRQTETTIQSDALVCPAGFEVFLPPTIPCRDSANNVSSFILAPQTTDSSSTGFIGNFNTSYDLERGSLSLNASRKVLPNALSGTTVTDNLLARFEHNFSERLQGNLRVQWTRSDDSSDNQLRLDRTLLRITPGLAWKFARDWSFRASYRYTRQSQEEIDEDAIDNTAMLNLTYRWPKMAVSR